MFDIIGYFKGTARRPTDVDDQGNGLPVSEGTPTPSSAATPSPLTKVALNISTATVTAPVAAGAGAVTIKVYRLRLFVAGANNITINDATPEFIPFSGPGSLIYDYSGIPWFTTAAATAFTITTSTTAAVTGTVEYIKS